MQASLLQYISTMYSILYSLRDEVLDGTSIQQSHNDCS
jgi:hypothetical protein